MDQKIFENEADFAAAFIANKKEVCEEAVARLSFKMLNSCVCAKETMEVIRYFNDIYWREWNEEQRKSIREKASQKDNQKV